MANIHFLDKLINISTKNIGKLLISCTENLNGILSNSIIVSINSISMNNDVSLESLRFVIKVDQGKITLP